MAASSGTGAATSPVLAFILRSRGISYEFHININCEARSRVIALSVHACPVVLFTTDKGPILIYRIIHIGEPDPIYIIGL